MLANKFWSEKLNGFIRPAYNQCNTYLPKESLEENPRDPTKATICWNHVFHQKFPKMVCGRADHYHYPLYVLKDF